MKYIISISLIVAVLILAAPQANTKEMYYPPNEDFKRAVEASLNEILPQKVFDSTWKDFFHRYELFDSLDGWNKVQTTAGNIALVGAAAGDGGYYLSISTNAVNNDSSNAYKMQFAAGQSETLDFSKQSRFRTEMQVSSVANILVELLHGRDISLGESNGEVYGFQVSGSTLKGVSRSNATGSIVESLVTLQTISASTDYTLEARFFPKDKIVFFVNGVEKGVITTNLPIYAHYGLFDFYIQTTTTAVKSVNITFAEMIQRK